MGGFRIGKVMGIPITLRTSFFLLLLGFLLWQGPLGALLLLLVFGSVLLHELGHALVARRYQVPIIGIDLHFFGGAAKMATLPREPRKEVLIALAGPLASFSIATVVYLAYLLSGWRTLGQLASINLVLGLFNLLPALPMDGGRILRAALSPWLGLQRATAWAVKISRGLAIAMALYGLLAGHLLLALLALMLWLMAGAELRAVQLLGRWGRPVAEAPDVELLDRQGRPVAGAAPWGRHIDPRSFSIEEQRGDGWRRIVVRDADGQILLVTEIPQA